MDICYYWPTEEEGGGACWAGSEIGGKPCTRNDQYECEAAKERSTCFKCVDEKTCPFAYDLYNTNGDCLASK